MVKIILAIGAIVGISTLHIALVSVLPAPLNTVNIPVVALVYLLLTKRTTLAIATAISVGFIMELYAVTPFGLLLTSLVTTLLAGMFLTSRILTTVSFGGAMTLTFFMVMAARFSFWALLGAIALVNPAIAMPSFQFVESLLIEGMLTTAIAAAVFWFIPLPHHQPTLKSTYAFRA
ncbi:MAG: hypothetical protein AAB579_01950 [Patescibacteria group bacterium]